MPNPGLDNLTPEPRYGSLISSSDVALQADIAALQAADVSLDGRLDALEVQLGFVRQISSAAPSGTITGNGAYQAPSNGSVTFTTVTGAKVLCIYTGGPSSSPGSANAAIVVSGATSGTSNNLWPAITSATGTAVHFLFSSVTAGSNTFSIQFLAAVGTTVNMNQGSIVSVFTVIELVPRL